MSLPITHRHQWMPMSNDPRLALCGQRVERESPKQTWEARKAVEMNLPECEACKVAEAADRLSGHVRITCGRCKSSGVISKNAGIGLEARCPVCQGAGFRRRLRDELEPDHPEAPDLL